MMRDVDLVRVVELNSGEKTSTQYFLTTQPHKTYLTYPSAMFQIASPVYLG